MPGTVFKYYTDTNYYDKKYLASAEAALKSLGSKHAYEVKVTYQDIEEVIAVFVNGVRIYGSEA